ncbi:hypothetical protein BC828DRAFT_386758, partial [Blastocladiella britannica]
MINIHHSGLTNHILTIAAGQSLSVLSALAIAHVQLRVDTPDVMSAILMRGFCELLPSVAIKHRTTLQYYPVATLKDDARACVWHAVAKGNTLALDALWAVQEIREEWITRAVLQQDRLLMTVFGQRSTVVLDWLEAHGLITPTWPAWDTYEGPQYWLKAIESGSQEALEWSHSRGCFHLPPEETYGEAFGHGHLHVVDWAARSVYKGDDDQLNSILASAQSSFSWSLMDATRRGLLPALAWWRVHVTSYAPRAILPNANELDTIVTAALEGGRTDVAEWWWSMYRDHYHKRKSQYASDRVFCGRGSIEAAAAAAAAATSGSVTMLEWLWTKSKLFPHAFDCDWDQAFASGHYPVKFGRFNVPSLTWWSAQLADRQIAFHVLPLQIRAAAQNCSLDVLQWLWTASQQCPQLVIVEWSPYMLSAALQSASSTALLDWLWQNRASFPDQHRPPAFDVPRTPTSTAPLAQCQWWADRYRGSLTESELVAMGRTIVVHGELKAIGWWFELLDLDAANPGDHDHDAAARIVADLFASAGAPVVLEMLVLACQHHQISVPGQEMAGLKGIAVRAWWDTYCACK